MPVKFDASSLMQRVIPSPYSQPNRLGWRACWVILSFIWLGIGSLPLKAAPDAFTIDPGQSYVTLSAKLVGLALNEQSPGSLTTALLGTVNAEVTPTSIQFTGLSGVNASTNGSWQPLPGGLAGTAPADFGARGNLGPLGTVQIAVRSLVLDARSELLPLENGAFAGSGIRFVVGTNAPAAFDFTVGSLKSGSRIVAGVGTNQMTSQAMLTVATNVETLRFDIDVEYPFAAFIDNDSTVSFRGTVVATRSVAGPASVSPVIRSISIVNRRVVVQIEGELRQNYRLESCRRLPEWTAHNAEITVDGGKYTLTTDKSDSGEFFRVAQ